VFKKSFDDILAMLYWDIQGLLWLMINYLQEICREKVNSIKTPPIGERCTWRGIQGSLLFGGANTIGTAARGPF
jgi:hypothetical protein